MKTAILFLFLVIGVMPTHAQDPTPSAPVAEEVLPESDVTDEGAATPTDEEATATEPADEETTATEPADEEATATETTDETTTATEPTAVPETEVEAIGMIGAFVKAVNDGDWTLVFAFGVMILIYLVRRLGLLDKLPTDAVVWVSLGVGVLGCTAAALIDGAALGAAILQGIVLGLSSAGLWSAGGKHGLPLAKADAD